jgi:predicted membrane-bound mannosyltransferase
MDRMKNIPIKSVDHLKSHFNREIAFYIAITLVALIMRLWQLGERAVHYDEGIHFGCGWNIFSNPAAWCYEPWVHGPFQFIGTGIIYNIFGDTEFSARLLPAIFGTAIVILPYFLRRQLGRWGALATAIILAFSPLLMYYSRYARGDIYHAFFTLLLVVCIWNYIADRRQRWLYIGAAALSLDFCTLETTYINLAIIAFFLFILVGISLLKNLIAIKDKKARIRQVLGRLRSLSTLKSLVLRKDWVLRIKRVLSRLKCLSPQAEILLLLGTLALPLFAVFINVFSLIKTHGLNSDGSVTDLPLISPINDLSNPVAIGIVVFFFLVSAVVGLMWNPRRWIIAAAIFYGLFIMVWSVFFTHMHGVAVGLWGDAAYWISQHGVARGGQPGFYYVMLIPIYEFLPLLFASAGAIYFAIKGNLFSRFLIYWFVMSFIIYSVFGEKMPWISLNIVVPTAALGGMFIGFLLKAKRWKRTLRIVIRACIAIIVIWLFSYTVYTACRESYQVQDTPSQMLMYAGISADVPRIKAQIDALAIETGMGYDMPITVESNTYDSGWRWYLRDYRNVSTPDLTTISGEPAGAVLIISIGHDPSDKTYLSKYSEGEKIQMLIWFPEEYKTKISPDWWWGYFLHRETDGPDWNTEAIVYFLKGDS